MHFLALKNSRIKKSATNLPNQNLQSPSKKLQTRLLYRAVNYQKHRTCLFFYNPLRIKNNPLIDKLKPHSNFKTQYKHPLQIYNPLSKHPPNYLQTPF